MLESLTKLINVLVNVLLSDALLGSIEPHICLPEVEKCHQSRMRCAHDNQAPRSLISWIFCVHPTERWQSLYSAFPLQKLVRTKEISHYNLTLKGLQWGGQKILKQARLNTLSRSLQWFFPLLPWSMPNVSTFIALRLILPKFKLLNWLTVQKNNHLISQKSTTSFYM